MNKKIKIFIFLFFIVIFYAFFYNSFAKYVTEDIYVAFKLDIDCSKPDVELLYITTSNKNNLITGQIKITEKNIVKNDFSSDNIKVKIDNNFVVPEFKSFSLISENTTEKVYEFSFTNISGNGSLAIVIPEGIVEDKSGFINEAKYFNTDISIN